jgi:tRNA (guanine-N7-)-methyltransferase
MSAGPEAFFGRRKGRPLRPHSAEAMQELLPRLRIDISKPASADFTALFAGNVAAIRLEIGFGGGEHLRAEAARFPHVGFFGAEAFVNGMAKMVAALERAPQENIRLFDDDATLLLDWLPPACLSGIDLFYPDPWPKKRHWKRRFVNKANLDRFARVLAPGGLFRFASDIDDYVNWTLQHCRAHPALEWLALRADDWRRPFEGWPGTRYEAKALREGRAPAYLRFVRC